MKKKKHTLIVSQWDQQRYDLGEITLDEIIKKNRLKKPVSQRKNIVNILLAFIVALAMIMIAKSYNNYVFISSLIAIGLSARLMYWNNLECEEEI